MGCFKNFANILHCRVCLPALDVASARSLLGEGTLEGARPKDKVLQSLAPGLLNPSVGGFVEHARTLPEVPSTHFASKRGACDLIFQTTNETF